VFLAFPDPNPSALHAPFDAAHGAQSLSTTTATRAPENNTVRVLFANRATQNKTEQTDLFRSHSQTTSAFTTRTPWGAGTKRCSGRCVFPTHHHSPP
jgi:hypothetical protein